MGSGLHSVGPVELVLRASTSTGYTTTTMSFISMAIKEKIVIKVKQIISNY